MPSTNTPFSLAGKRVWVAGHRGMVGGAVVRRLGREDCAIVTVDRGEVDLRRQDQVEAWVQRARPHAVFLTAATVGGILANDTRPADFLYDNLAIQTNVIHAAYRAKVEKLLFTGSSCIYPKFAPQPMPEDCLLTGPLEPTNQWYAVAKIAGLKMCEAYAKQYGCRFISAQPTNLYGPGDNFNLTSSHVVPALIAKAHAAKVRGDGRFEVWGSGSPLREFLYVEDLADALVFLMKTHEDPGHVNVGSGEEVSIRRLAELVCAVVGLRAQLVFDPSKPDGTPRKLLDVGRLAGLGWKARTDLETGLGQTYQWFLEHHRPEASPPRRAAVAS